MEALQNVGGSWASSPPAARRISLSSTDPPLAQQLLRSSLPGDRFYDVRVFAAPYSWWDERVPKAIQLPVILELFRRFASLALHFDAARRLSTLVDLWLSRCSPFDPPFSRFSARTSPVALRTCSFTTASPFQKRTLHTSTGSPVTSQPPPPTFLI